MLGLGPSALLLLVFAAVFRLLNVPVALVLNVPVPEWASQTQEGWWNREMALG
jgi:hypothetical protein